MTVAEREKLPGIDAKRAEIIVPGALVLAEVLERLELDGITISDFGVREGLVTDWLASHARELKTLEQVEDLRMRSVIQLAQKFDADMPHAEHVARLALALFDGLRSRHGLGDAERETLHFAALLHDVGNAIGFDGHAEHSYYVIRHGNLRGLAAEEIERIAAVARFHSKTRPRKRERSYRDLDKPGRRTVRWLSALLRIAEGLDRSHYQLIRNLRVVRGRKSIGLKIAALGDAQLELWAARRRADVLEDLLGMPVRVSSERSAIVARRPAVVSKVVRRAARHAAQRARSAAPVAVVRSASTRAGSKRAPAPGARTPRLRAVRGMAQS